jgi:predicted ATP-grasp superfamily ATP-dependent carboligase
MFSPLAQLGLKLDKVRYFREGSALYAYMEQFEKLDEFPIVQEYCPGYGLGQFIFMHHGEAILRFQHRRIHEYPPEGGFSTLCEGLAEGEHAKVLSQSIELLRRLEWEGPAMVEYRYDPVQREARLMEVNGRFWGSLPLAHYSGAEFAWLTYAVLGEGKQSERCHPRAGIRCRSIVTDTKRLLQILFASNRIQDPQFRVSKASEFKDFFKEFLNPKTRYFVFDRDDWKPFVADALFSLVGKLRHE